MEFFEKTKKSERLFCGKLIDVSRHVVELPDGSESWREVVEHPGGVCIAAVDDDRNIYLVEQYRYPMQEVTLELPAGKLEPDEDPRLAAERELSEETGISASEIKNAGVLYPSPGYCGERLYLFIATGLTQGEQHLDEGELVRCHKMPLRDAVALVLNNEIKDAKSVALIVMADNLINV